jgi:hypothetical protein
MKTLRALIVVMGLFIFMSQNHYGKVESILVLVVALNPFGLLFILVGVTLTYINTIERG